MVAVLVAWVVANRLVGLSTGSVRPGFLLVIGAVVVGVALAACNWGSAWRRQISEGSLAVARNPDSWNVRLIATVAAAVRLAVLFRVPVLVNGDSGVYLLAARTLGESGSLAPLDAMYPPLYMIFLTTVQVVLGPDLFGIVFLQHVLGVMTAIATYRIAREILPAGIALVPALATSVNGNLLLLEHGVYTEGLFIPLVTIASWLVMRTLADPTHRLSAASGAAFAITCLTRIVVQPLVALIAIALVIVRWPISRQSISKSGTFIGTFLVVITPWLGYNWAMEGYFGLVRNAAPSLLPRLWEEEATYVYANPSQSDPELLKILSLLQDAKDLNLSYWQAWTIVRRNVPEERASSLVVAGIIDVVLRHPGLFADRTWFRMQRMWAGGFARERVHDLYGSQKRLGIRSPIFEVRDDGLTELEIERAGNQGDAIMHFLLASSINSAVSLGLTVLAVAVTLRSKWFPQALVPITMGIGLLVLPVVLNADRARYRHPAEPFLMVTYTIGAYALWQVAWWMWNRVRATLSTMQGQDLPRRSHQIPPPEPG